VRLELDALGADHRLDVAPCACRPLFGAEGAVADGKAACIAVRFGGRIEQVRDAEEVRDEGGARLLVHLARRPRLFHVAVVHDRHTIAHRQRLFLIVRHEDEGDADVVLDRLQLDLEVFAEPRVEGAERLVQEQHSRCKHECACERDALLLPARELRGLALLEAAQPNELQDRAHPSLPLLFRQPLVLQPEGDVVGDVEVREERIALEHGVDAALVRGDARDVAAVEDDPSARRQLEARDHSQRRRLAAARRPEQGEELARRHVEVDPVDRDDVFEAFGEPLELDLAFH